MIKHLLKKFVVYKSESELKYLVLRKTVNLSRKKQSIFHRTSI